MKNWNMQYKNMNRKLEFILEYENLCIDLARLNKK